MKCGQPQSLLPSGYPGARLESRDLRKITPASLHALSRTKVLSSALRLAGTILRKSTSLKNKDSANLTLHDGTPSFAAKTLVQRIWAFSPVT